MLLSQSNTLCEASLLRRALYGETITRAWEHKHGSGGLANAHKQSYATLTVLAQCSLKYYDSGEQRFKEQADCI